MGLVQLSSGIPAFKKVVISLWFRVPQVSIDTAFAEYDSDSEPPPLLNGVLPLIVFGKKGIVQDSTITDGPVIEHAYYVHKFDWNGSAYVEEPEGNVVGSQSGWDVLFTQVSQSAGAPYRNNLSFIGIDCSDGLPRLSFNFETTIRPSVSGVSFIDTSATASDYTDYTYDAIPPYSPEPPDPPTWTLNATVKDVTSDSYQTAAYGGLCLGATITPDDWHHLLLSVDISNGCQVEGILGTSTDGVLSPPVRAHDGDGVITASKLWIAFDDINLTRENLSTSWPEGYDEDNAIIASGANFSRVYNVEVTTTSIVDIPGLRKSPATIKTLSGMTKPSYSLGSVNIPASGVALGIPGTDAVVDKIQRVELAELQIFTGVTIDTGSVANRRLFIKDDGTPETNYTELTKALGTPDIRLHGSGNWKRGRNTGSGGDFDAIVGDIKRYKPNPSLNGPQG